ncbi:MAG: LPS export ABC transporter permease LptG [Acidobacteriota bacterium]
MTRIHRIIYQEVAPPSCIALLVLTFVVFTREFGRISRLFIQQGAEAGMIGEMVLALLPPIFVYTIPLSLLIGTLVGFSRLSAESEVVAMRAGGVSIYQMIWPVLKLAVIVAAVTVAMTFILFPMANWHLQLLRAEMGASPVPSEIKARVFFEGLPDKILYIEDQDLRTSHWKGVFLADSGGSDNQAGKRVILAQSGRLIVSPDKQRLQLRFEGGLSYRIDPQAPEKYTWTSFQTLDVPVPLPKAQVDPALPKRPREKRLQELEQDIEQGTPRERRFSLVELNRRIALPVSALLFALLGVTLGSRSHRGGRAYGLVLGMALAFAYYALLEAGVQAAEDEVVSILTGLWGPNIILAWAGILSLRLIHTDPALLSRLANHRFALGLVKGLRWATRRLRNWWRALADNLRERRWRRADVMPRIARVIDLYVARMFLLYLILTLAATTALYYLFTFFDLANDIFSNRIDSTMVIEYFIYLLPHVLSLLIPISTLIATLIAFGVLEKTRQVVALKACGVSLYQITLPVFGLALLISSASYLNQEYLLPFANQHQDSLRAQIKGRPAQTYYTPGRNWIFGNGNRLYNYAYFHPDRDRFAELSVYELDITGNRLISHTYAHQAFWDRNTQSWRLEDGWSLHFASPQDRFERFDQARLESAEAPDYFEAEVRESSKMTYPELYGYIQQLQQGGFEVDHLKTELYTKLSLPLVPLIMALIGIPFAFTLGRKGALYGLATGVLIGMVYWGTFGAFGVLGASGLLTPILAAWGPNLIFAAGGAFLFLTVRT